MIPKAAIPTSITAPNIVKVTAMGLVCGLSLPGTLGDHNAPMVISLRTANGKLTRTPLWCHPTNVYPWRVGVGILFTVKP